MEEQKEGDKKGGHAVNEKKGSQYWLIKRARFLPSYVDVEVWQGIHCLGTAFILLHPKIDIDPNWTRKITPEQHFRDLLDCG